MVPVPHMAKVCLHFGCICPSGEGLHIRKPMVIAEVKALKAPVISRQYPVSRDFQIGIATGLVAGKDRPVCASNVYFIRALYIPLDVRLSGE